MLNQRRAKIVCTLGPSSSSPDKLRALIRAGMNVARLNFSHADHATYRALIPLLRGIAREENQPLAILQDLQGPKIRIGRLPKGQVELHVGDRFTLSGDATRSAMDSVGVSYPEFPTDVTPGTMVLLDDGKLRLEVQSVEGSDVRCVVRVGGMLSDRKGLNIPNALLSVPALSEKDRADAKFGVEAGVDWIAMSFVQRAADVEALRTFVRSVGGEQPIVAKIEKPQAVADIDEILKAADAIMVARGDLGVEMAVERVPAIQKKLIAASNRAGVPVITATQMLESMVHAGLPTRAEASDVANAILDGTDAVMLSAETATGEYPIEAVETMARIISTVEQDPFERWDLKRRQNGTHDIATAIGYSASQAADMIAAAAIVCLTQSGSTARLISRFRPNMPILAMTSFESTRNQLALLWGVNALITADFGDNVDLTVAELLIFLRNQGWVQRGERVVITTGLPFNARRPTNTVRIEEIP